MCLRVASEVTLLEIPPCQTPMCGVTCCILLFLCTLGSMRKVLDGRVRTFLPTKISSFTVLERFSKPNTSIRFGSGRTGSKIVSKFRLTHNRKLRSANRNTIYHTIACPALLLWCLAVENRGPQVSHRMFFVKLCKSGGLLPSPRSLVIPWPTPLAHSFTDDGHVPAENLLPK